MMSKSLRSVGLHVHKASIPVAMADEGREPARLLETSSIPFKLSWGMLAAAFLVGSFWSE